MMKIIAMLILAMMLVASLLEIPDRICNFRDAEIFREASTTIHLVELT
ncbi:MAG: hypothetical protein IPM91_00870 [Bacteroidetes bacterium]|nr:hypothetical protein [Bacteroidota bacterium]